MLWAEQGGEMSDLPSFPDEDALEREDWRWGVLTRVLDLRALPFPLEMTVLDGWKEGLDAAALLLD